MPRSTMRRTWSGLGVQSPKVDDSTLVPVEEATVPLSFGSHLCNAVTNSVVRKESLLIYVFQSEVLMRSRSWRIACPKLLSATAGKMSWRVLLVANGGNNGPVWFSGAPLQNAFSQSTQSSFEGFSWKVLAPVDTTLESQDSDEEQILLESRRATRWTVSQTILTMTWMLRPDLEDSFVLLPLRQ